MEQLRLADGFRFGCGFMLAVVLAACALVCFDAFATGFARSWREASIAAE